MPPFVGRARAYSYARRKPASTSTGTGQSPGTGANPIPATTGVVGGGAGEFFEDFKSDFAMGSYDFSARGTDYRLWGDNSKAQHSPAGTGTIKLFGTYDGVGFMTRPSGRAAGYGQGLFEVCARFTTDTGNVGDNSGPALVVWPADDVWITTAGYPEGIAQEIDIGEIDPNGDVYYATHWYSANWAGGNAWKTFHVWQMPDAPIKTFYNDWHTYAVFVQKDRLTYYLDGKQVGVDTEHSGADLANGGLNHAFGFMNRSSGTTCEADWMRWTPEATMLSKLSGATPTAATPAALDLAGPGGGSAGTFGIQLQGQSNAVFWYNNGSATEGTPAYYPSSVFNQVLRALTNLAAAQTGVVAGEGAGALSIAGGTGTYNLSSNDNVWLRGFDQNWGAPSSWPNNGLMNDFLNWAKAEADKVPAGRPIALVRMHTEYDSRLGDSISQERDVYEAVSREFIKRWRDRIGRGVSLTPVFLVPVPYYSYNEMATVMRTAWRNMCADAALNCYMAVGSTMDVGSRESAANGGNGYLSHWDSGGSARVARRMAIRIAKWMHANGYANRDLSSLPTFGPRIVSFARVSGQANKLDLAVQHDGGTDLVVPTGALLKGLEVGDNGTARNVTAVARQDASTLRVTLDGNLSANGPITVDYGRGLWTYESVDNPGGTVTDNWHTLPKPVSDTELAAARMPLQRLRAPIVEGTTNTGAGTGTGTSTGGTGTTTARSLAFSPKDPPAGATSWNTVLQVSGITRIAWTVQNDGALGWTDEFVPVEVAVPANGQVALTIPFNKNGQFAYAYDVNDPAFRAFSGSFYFA